MISARKIIVVALAAICSLSVTAQKTVLEKEKADAHEKNALILLNFSGSDWCIPCIRMEKQIFESSVFTEYAKNRLILVHADFPRLKKNKLSKDNTAINNALADRYNKQGSFPFTVLLDADGKPLKSWDGYPAGDAETFVAEIRKISDAKH